MITNVGSGVLEGVGVREGVNVCEGVKVAVGVGVSVAVGGSGVGLGRFVFVGGGGGRVFVPPAWAAAVESAFGVRCAINRALKARHRVKHRLSLSAERRRMIIEWCTLSLTRWAAKRAKYTRWRSGAINDCPMTDASLPAQD